MTNRKANRAALSRVQDVLANGKPDEEKTFPISDATRAVLMGMQLQRQGIKESQDALALIVSSYNSTMQAIGSLAAAAESRDTKEFQLDVDRMVWVERKK